MFRPATKKLRIATLLARTLFFVFALAGSLFIQLSAWVIDPLYGSALSITSAVLFYSGRRSPREGLFVLVILSATAGWLITSVPGQDIHFSVALALALAAGYLTTSSQWERRTLSIGHNYLGWFAFLAIASGMVTAAKYLAFTPIPALSQLNIAINSIGTSRVVILHYVLFYAAAYLAWFLVFSISGNIDVEHSTRSRLRLVFALLVFANSVAIVLQFFIFIGLFAPNGMLTDGRANGLTSFCNALSNVMALIIVFAPLWFGKQGKGLVLSLGILVSALFNLYFAGGRSGMVLVGFCAAAMLVVAILYRRAIEKEHRKWIYYSVGGFLLLNIIVMVSEFLILHQTPMLIQRFGVLLANMDYSYFFFLRGGMWGFATHIITLNPLGGMGAGTFFSALADFSKLLGMPSWFIDNALNQYLNIGAELGLWALLLVLLFFGYILSRAFSVWKKSGDVRTALTIIPVVGVLLFFNLGAHLNDPETMITFWMFIGLFYSGILKNLPASRPNPVNTKTKLTLAGISLLSVAAMIWGAFEYSPSQLYDRLHWHLESGMYPTADATSDGRWSSPDAIVSYKPDENILHIKWHVGDPAMQQTQHVVLYHGIEILYQGVVSDSAIRDSYFWVGPGSEQYRPLGITVRPGFVPNDVTGNGDMRQLGMRIHQLETVDTLPDQFTGFYAEEPDGSRWSGETCYIQIPADVTKATLAVHAPHKDIGSQPVELTFLVNGNVAERIVLKQNNWQPIELHFADMMLKSPGLLTLKINRTWNPAEHDGSTDNRTLGVAVKNLIFE